ncbi:hypothetical protein AAMO2058_001522800 [Amorphochlora amoebiformis]
MIKNVAKVNEDANARMIREMKAEIERLRKQLKDQGPQAVQQTESPNDLELKEMRSKLMQAESLMKDMAFGFEEKLKRAKSLPSPRIGIPTKAFNDLSIVNLHPDEQLNNVLVYTFEQGITKVCRRDMVPPPKDTDVVLGGLQIQRNHADILRQEKEVIISPVGNARVFVNGNLVIASVKLKHNDRILFGAHHFYRFVDPSKKTPEDKEFNYQFAHREFAEMMFKIEDTDINYKERMKENDEEKQILEEKLMAMEEERKKILAERASIRAKMEKKLKELEKKNTFEIAQLQRMKSRDDREKRMLDNRLKEKTEKAEEEKLKLLQELEKREQSAQSAAKKLEESMKREEDARLKRTQYLETEEKKFFLLKQQLLHMLPIVSDANSICQELGKRIFFNVRIISSKTSDKDAFTQAAEVFVEIIDLESSQKSLWNQVFVEIIDLESSQKSLWNQDLLMEKMNEIQESYTKHLQEVDERIDRELEARAFTATSNAPQLIGTARVDHTSADQQLARIKGFPLKLTILIAKAVGLPKDVCRQVFCEYKFNKEQKVTITEPVKSVTMNPVIKHARDVIIDPVSDSLIKTVTEGAIQINVYGYQSYGRQGGDRKRLTMEAQLAIDEVGDIKEMLAEILPGDKHRNYPASQQLQELIIKYKASSAEVIQLNSMLADDKKNDMVVKIASENKDLEKKFHDATHEVEMLKSEKVSLKNKLDTFKRQLDEADENQENYGKNHLALKDAERALKDKDEEIEKLREEYEKEMQKMKDSASTKQVEDLEMIIKNQKSEIRSLQDHLREKNTKGGWCCSK